MVEVVGWKEKIARCDPLTKRKSSDDCAYQFLHLLRDGPTCLDSSVVEDVLEREQECRGEDRLGDLGCNAYRILAFDEQVLMIVRNVPP